jgi:hypothetical protein
VPKRVRLETAPDRLLIALVREHGQPRYDYPPKLVQYYKLDGRKHVEPSRHLLAIGYLSRVW